MKYNKLTLIFLLIMTQISCNKKQEVDLIIFNGNIYTVDSIFSKATAFAVKDGKFLSVGNDKDILKSYKSKQIIDIQGKSVYPGFNDGHCHFVGYGENCIRYADLKGATSFDEVIQRLENHNKNNKSEWLLGRGWDQNLWENKDFPDNSLLHKHFPDKKVLLTRVDGHAVLVTDNILEMADINGNSIIEGGQVIVNEDNKPTGILLDNAADITKNLIPQLNMEQKIAALLKSQNDCFEYGLTSVTDAGLDIESIELIDSLQEQGVLKMRVNAMINPDEETMDYFMKQGIIIKPRLTIRSVKIYADGALGSRGAKLIEPYSDAPETSGLMVNDDEFYNNVCEKAYQNGYQVCTHAIGDSGVRNILHIYSKFLKGQNDLRWRVEHSQVVNNEDFKLYQEYNIIPSIQSTHCTSDMTWAEERLGTERIRNAYAYKTLLEQNGWLVNGTDFPIEHINPLYTFFASVIRKDLNHNPINGFQLENALSREEALCSMTIWAAKGSFEENRKGSIEVGKDADFVILSNDIMEADEMVLPKIQVMNLYVLGEKVFER